MFASKYADGYLEANLKRGLGKGLTPASYINTFWSGGNLHQSNKLARDMQKHTEIAFPFSSTRGRIAYYPISMMDKTKIKKYRTLVAIWKLDPYFDARKYLEELCGQSWH
jgi:hypothetical protein